MRLKPLHVLLIIIMALAGCARNEHRFVIIGDIKNMPPQQVLLEELGINEITVIDSAHTDEKGGFELSGVAPEPGLYRLSFQGNQFILLSVSQGNLKVSGDWQSLHDYQVSGSAPSRSLQHFLRTVREYVRDINTISEVIRTMQERGNDSLLTDANNDMREINLQLTRFIEHYADTTSDLPNALFAVQILNPSAEKVYLQAFSGGLNRRFPDRRLAKDFIAKFDRIAAREAAQSRQLASDSNDTDPEAPDFVLNTPDGQAVRLSSFKGKYVLLDFWASWCAPCRAENPNVVTAYHKFKEKNFTVLGVSLDQKKELWEKAIRQDNLEWTNVSDLQGWSSTAARMYQVESIPANFLIDPDGKIIASNLRGPALEAHLEQILK